MNDRCAWCEQTFEPRATGGKRQRYHRECKQAHQFARTAWAEEQERQGAVSLRELRNAADRKRRCSHGGDQ
jgi:hypothetical protein